MAISNRGEYWRVLKLHFPSLNECRLRQIHNNFLRTRKTNEYIRLLSSKLRRLQIQLTNTCQTSCVKDKCAVLVDRINRLQSVTLRERVKLSNPKHAFISRKKVTHIRRLEPNSASLATFEVLRLRYLLVKHEVTNARKDRERNFVDEGNERVKLQTKLRRLRIRNEELSRKRLVARRIIVNKKMAKRKSICALRKQKELVALDKLNDHKKRIRVVADRDPRRILQPTLSTLGRRYGRSTRVKCQRFLCPLRSFTENQLMSDVRYKASTALYEAGLRHSSAALNALRLFEGLATNIFDRRQLRESKE